MVKQFGRRNVLVPAATLTAFVPLKLEVQETALTLSTAEPL